MNKSFSSIQSLIDTPYNKLVRFLERIIKFFSQFVFYQTGVQKKKVTKIGWVRIYRAGMEDQKCII